MKFPFYKIALFIFSLFFAVGLAACSGSRAESNKNANANTAGQPTVVNTTTTPAVLRELPQFFEATGNLASDQQTDVAPTVGGKVVAVNFDAGGYVNRGDVLVRLDDRDARIRLEQAQAAVAQQEAAVRQAEAGVQQAQQNVRQTQARLGLTEGSNFDIETFSQVRATQAQLDLAEKELRRFERLLETGDVSRSQYDQRRAQRDQLRAQLDESRSTAAVAVQAIRTAQATVSTAQQQVNAARAGVANAQTQVAAAQKAINDAVIYSPISGTVQERNADPGEFVSTTGKIATIVRTNPLRMRIDVPEQSIGQTRVGQSISLTTSAYPDRQFAGTIVRIVPGLNPTSRTMTAEAEVNNIDGLLKPGQFATVKILLPESRRAVMVPTAGVRQEGNTARIFVVKDGRAQERIVTLGEVENDMVEVKNGVAPDERVATSNIEQIYDGVQVNQ
ncbi:MAG: efflux RND transporter periplasmic adaptor subunit [Acidobacteriota bacterium]|nr:efflux RND transporter periplasmic adaptor subunit [Acidobacteriota bacterium]